MSNSLIDANGNTLQTSDDALLGSFSYDKDTGQITRLHRAGNVKAGSVCNRPDSKGYLRVHFQGKDYKLHRLAWFLHYKEWPVQQLDHVDGDKQNNRIANLRECNTSENCSNQHKARVNNQLGIQGVHYIPNTGKYRAKFRNKGLGCFDTPDQAHLEYLKAKKGYNNL